MHSKTDQKPFNFTHALAFLWCAVATLGLDLQAHAQASMSDASAYPYKSVHLIVPFPAGGALDMVARIIAKPLGEQLGQTVVVDNKGVGNGTIGLDACAKATPDGHTLSMVTGSASVNVAMVASKAVPSGRTIW